MADESAALRVGPSRPSFDPATVLGLGGGLVLVLAALVLGGSAGAFFDVPSGLIVIGGTLSVTTACFTLPEMAGTVPVLAKAVFHGGRDASETALRLLRLSDISRKHGILSLQEALPRLETDPFLKKGLAMVIDGTPAEEVAAIMERDILATQNRHRKAAGILRKGAEVAPAMGLIGTLIGLVQMLGNLSDPSTLGPSMALALLTTLYGAILAYMVLGPLAAKLDRNSAEEGLVNQLNVIGVLSIGRQENPRRLEMLLNSALPPAKRVRFCD